MPNDVDLLRRIARGEGFKAGPHGIVQNGETKEGGYIQIMPTLTPAGQDLLNAIGGRLE